MKKHLLLFATLMAMAFVACDKYDVEEVDHPSSIDEKITVTAFTPEQEESKTRISNNYGNDSWTLSWSNDDTFSVLRGDENQTFTKAAEANLFTGMLPQAGSGTYYASYPTTEATDITAVPYDFSEPTQATQYLMYSSSESGTEYQFNHALAYLRLTINGYEGAMTRLIITTPEGTSTNGTIDITKGELTPGEKRSVTLNYDESNYAEAGQSINAIPIPPLAADNKTLIINVLSNNGKSYTATLAGEVGKAIEAGKFYTATVEVEEMNELLCYLPESSRFADEIADFISFDYNGITFVANSSTTSENEIQCVTGEKAYIVLDTDNKIEIHTIASKFVFNEDCSDMFNGSKNTLLQELTFINFNNCCDTSKVQNMKNMFTGCTLLTDLDLSSFDTAQVTNMSGMFEKCVFLKPLDVSGFDTAKVTDMSSMFARCESLQSLDVSGFNTAQVQNMANMFYGCTSLTTLDVSGFDTAQVTNMNNMFYYCKQIAALDVSGFNTAKVTDMSNMFFSCQSITTLDVSGFDTAQVTNMNSMFYQCLKVTALDVSGFDTAQVTNMGGIFSACSTLTTIDVSGFDTAKVTDMSHMFQFCTNLKSLDVTNFNTSATTLMNNMFFRCSGLTSLNISNFDTAEVTNMSCMFYQCSSLTTLDVSGFNTAKVTDMSHMFHNCYELTALDLSKFNTSAVTLMNNMFELCLKVEVLDLSSFDVSNVTNFDLMFNGLGGDLTDGKKCKIKVTEDTYNTLLPIDFDTLRSSTYSEFDVVSNI